MNTDSTEVTPYSQVALKANIPYRTKQSLLTLVSEYLRFNGFHDTCDCLRAEKQAVDAEQQTVGQQFMSHPNASKARSIEARLVQERVKRSLFRAFDTGNWDQFDSVWDRNISDSVGHESHQHTMSRLRFKIAVHFATFHLRYEEPNVSNTRKHDLSMDKFRVFIEREKLAQNVLGNTVQPNTGNREDLTIFYALPYVPNPRVHSSMAYIFDELWSLNLKKELSAFLHIHMQTISTPRLMTIFSMWENAERLVECHIKELTSNYKTLERITHAVFTVALSTLSREENVHNDALDVSQSSNLLAQKSRLMDLMNELVALDKNQKKSPAQLLQEMPKRLNFNAIRWQLRHSDSKIRAALLNAMRTRLRKWQPKAPTVCRELISSLVDGDVFELNIEHFDANLGSSNYLNNKSSLTTLNSSGTSISQTDDSTVPLIFKIKEDSAKVRKSFVQLCHTMSCSYEGKHYLASDNFLVQILCDLCATLLNNLYDQVLDSKDLSITIHPMTARTMSVLHRLSLSSKICALLSQANILKLGLNLLSSFVTKTLKSNSMQRYTSLISSIMGIITNLLCYLGNDTIMTKLERFLPTSKLVACLLNLSSANDTPNWLVSAAIRALYIIAANPRGREMVNAASHSIINLKMIATRGRNGAIADRTLNETKLLLRRLETKNKLKKFPVPSTEVDFDQEFDEETDVEDNDQDGENETIRKKKVAAAEIILAPYYVLNRDDGNPNAVVDNGTVVQSLFQNEKRKTIQSSPQINENGLNLNEASYYVGQTVDIRVSNETNSADAATAGWSRGKISFIHFNNTSRQVMEGISSKDNSAIEYDVILDSGDKLSHIKPNKLIPCFKAGEAVEANFGGLSDAWFTAIIVSRVCDPNNQPTGSQAHSGNNEVAWYKIRYGTHNFETLPASFLRMASPQWGRLGKSCVGLSVLVRCRQVGQSFVPILQDEEQENRTENNIGQTDTLNTTSLPTIHLVEAEIIHYNERRGWVSIAFKDGTVNERIHENQLLPLFRKGMPIESRFRGLTRWFTGIIKEVHKIDGAISARERGQKKMQVVLCDIEYADGHIESKVSPKCLRIFGMHLLGENEVTLSRQLDIKDTNFTIEDAHEKYLGNAIDIYAGQRARLPPGPPGPHPLSISATVEYNINWHQETVTGQLNKDNGSSSTKPSWGFAQIAACRSTTDIATQIEIFEYDVIFVGNPVQSEPTVSDDVAGIEEGDLIRNVPQEYVRMDITRGSHVQIWIPNNGDNTSPDDANHEWDSEGFWNFGVVVDIYYPESDESDIDGMISLTFLCC